jgi:hypothetical protein
MRQINSVPNHELFSQLRKLQKIAKEVAYANSDAEMEYFTMRYLRPELERVKQLIGDLDETDKTN